MEKKKKVMDIGMAGKSVTHDGKYRVHWGTTGTAYNRNSKAFQSRKRAIAFKNALQRKYKKNYKVRYMYMAD